MQTKAEEASLAAGVHASDIWIVDAAHPPAKPITPNLPFYLALTVFVSVWLAVGYALLAESLHPSTYRFAVLLLAAIAVAAAHAQAPTPSTSGLPTGVARLPATPDS